MIFSDPGDVAGEGQDQNLDVYPNTMFLPDTGIQRGSLLLFDGDPETPNMPSLPNVYRLSKEEIDQQNILPKIPCQPLGYRGAKEFMKVRYFTLALPTDNFFWKSKVKKLKIIIFSLIEWKNIDNIMLIKLSY